MQKRVVLLAPGKDFASPGDTGFTTPIQPPLSVLSLGSYLAAHGVPVEVIDVQMDFGIGLTPAAADLVCDRVVQYLCNHADAIAWIGVSHHASVLNSIPLAEKIFAALPRIPMVFGGHSATNSYKRLLRKFPFITAIVRGDGEAAALKICQSLSEEGILRYNLVPNLTWMDQGEIHTTPIKRQSLEHLPIVDFRLLRHPDCYQTIALMSSRGCPFQCNFCLENTMHDYAKHALDWITRQLDHVEAVVPNERVFFYDPLFGHDRKRTLEMCEAMQDRRFRYAVQSRVDVLAPDLLPAFREAGIELIFFGMESASPATLLRMNKVRSRASAERYAEKARELCEACYENGVTPMIGLMLNFPGDSVADFEATLDFVMEVQQMHRQFAGRTTGEDGGYIVVPNHTIVFEGSPLAGRLAKDFPETILGPEDSIGARTVSSPGPEVSLELVHDYAKKIVQHTPYNSTAKRKELFYAGFSLRKLLISRRPHADISGVVTFGDILRRL